MKMFNRVEATFSGTVDRVLIDSDGQIIKKAQPLFEVTPDGGNDRNEDVGEAVSAELVRDFLQELSRDV